MKVVVATQNAGKLHEIADVLRTIPIVVEGLKNYPAVLPMPEETGSSFEANARLKAHHVWSQLGGWVLADDSGLSCEDLEGAPGIYSARFAGPQATDEENNQKLIAALQAHHDACRIASYVCVLVLLDPQGHETVIQETCDGMITFVPSGTGGFGYDPYFYLPELKKTMAELPLHQKNQISHRGKALKKLLAILSPHQD